jgi:hypothetical protein
MYKSYLTCTLLVPYLYIKNILYLNRTFNVRIMYKLYHICIKINLISERYLIRTIFVPHLYIVLQSFSAFYIQCTKQVQNKYKLYNQILCFIKSTIDVHYASTNQVRFVHCRYTYRPSVQNKYKLYNQSLCFI